jgi:hypothetical protein
MARARRSCAAVRAEGRACGAGPQLDRAFCFVHDPERAAEAAEARTLGGLRRRREGTIATAYDLEGLDHTAGIRRVLDIAVADTLSLDNGIARNRTLIAGAASATRLLVVGDFEARLEALEAALPSGAARSGAYVRDEEDPFGESDR